MVNDWISTRCDSGHCAEVLDNYGDVFVRNSRDPKTTITFNIEEWKQFIEAVKRGEFDL